MRLPESIGNNWAQAQASWNILKRILNHDKGLVTVTELEELTPNLGDRADLIAGSGRVWNLVADGDPTETGYPWAVKGGRPLRSDGTFSLNTSSSSYQTTGQPSLTAPIDMVARFQWGCFAGVQVNVNALFEGIVALFFDATEKSGPGVAGSNQWDKSIPTPVANSTINKGQKANIRYRSAQSNSVSFYGMFVEAWPLRVR